MCKRQGFTPLEIGIEDSQPDKSRWLLTGFTLIELLVVIAIIALFMAILMPARSRARKQAKAIVCRSNLKQWGTATALYAAEYDAKMWRSEMYQGDWMAILRPYYADIDKIRCCTVAKKPSQDTVTVEYRGSVDTVWGVRGEAHEYGGREKGYWGSYGNNAWSTNRGIRQDPVKRDPEKYWGSVAVKDADDIPVLLDSTLSAAWPLHTEPIPPKPLRLFSDIPLDAPGCQIWRFYIDRHNGTINSYFLDASVRKIPLYNLWDLKWHRKWIPQMYTKADIPWLK